MELSHVCLLDKSPRETDRVAAAAAAAVARELPVFRELRSTLGRFFPPRLHDDARKL